MYGFILGPWSKSRWYSSTSLSIHSLNPTSFLASSELHAHCTRRQRKVNRRCLRAARPSHPGRVRDSDWLDRRRFMTFPLHSAILVSYFFVVCLILVGLHTHLFVASLVGSPTVLAKLVPSPFVHSIRRRQCRVLHFCLQPAPFPFYHRRSLCRPNSPYV